MNRRCITCCSFYFLKVWNVMSLISVYVGVWSPWEIWITRELLELKNSKNSGMILLLGRYGNRFVIHFTFLSIDWQLKIQFLPHFCVYMYRRYLSGPGHVCRMHKKSIMPQWGDHKNLARQPENNTKMNACRIQKLHGNLHTKFFLLISLNSVNLTITILINP